MPAAAAAAAACIHALASVMLASTVLGGALSLFPECFQLQICTFWLPTFREADGRWLPVHSACLIELTEFVLSPSLKRCKQHKFQEHQLISYPKPLTLQKSDLFSVILTISVIGCCTFNPALL